MITDRFILFLLLGWIGYLIVGRLTALLWTSWTPTALTPEDRRAIRILWWVFLPIGLSLYLIDGLAWLLSPLLLPKHEREFFWRTLFRLVSPRKLD